MIVYLNPSEQLASTNCKSYNFEFKRNAVVKELLDAYNIDHKNIKKDAFKLVTQKIGVIIMPKVPIIFGFVPQAEYFKHHNI